MSKEKIYCGNGKEKFNGDLIEQTICLSDLPKEFIFEYDGKKYIKLKCQKKKNIDEYGRSHYLIVDTFKPEKTDQPKPEQNDSETETDDLPF